MTVLARVVIEAAARFGDRPALVAGESHLTYADLDAASDGVAASLAAEGVGEGSVVALVHRSDFDWVLAAVALSKLGAVYSGVSPRLTLPEREAVLRQLAPDRVLADGDVAALRRSDGGAPRVPPVPPPDPERTCTVVFTSGTTGEPKGAEFREKQLDAITAADLGASSSDWGGGGPMLASTQFAHVGFATKLPSYLRTGSVIHVLERWRAADALRIIVGERIASVGGVAAQIGLLLRVPGLDDMDLSAVRTIVIGGGPSPAALVEEARRRFGARYSIRYSSTECGGVGTATAFDADDEETLHTVGRPRPGVEVRIDPLTSALELRSPSMMASYWRDPERTARVFTADGWLHTDDLAEIDEQGLVRLKGRATDMYIRGGYNVHPAEVEAVLLGHPGVAQVAVVARADAVMGELGVAVVVPADPTAPPALEDLRAFAADRLAAYKLPEAMVVRDELPLTAMDKLDRRRLSAEV